MNQLSYAPILVFTGAKIGFSFGTAKGFLCFYQQSEKNMVAYISVCL